MSNLSLDSPGLELAYQKYQEFNANDELRELAFYREKTERDRLARVDYLKKQYIAQGHAQGHAKGLTQGLTQGLAIGVINVLSAVYPAEMTHEQEFQINQIGDSDRLQKIMNAALERKPFEEIAALF